MKRSTQQLVFAGLCLAAGIVLPFVTGQIPFIGNLLLPMHIPVFVCAFCSSKRYSTAVGLILPLLRSALFSVPTFFPNAVATAVELATYALVASLIFHALNRRTAAAIYIAMLPSMLVGRIAWGVARWLMMGFGSEPFTLPYFAVEAFVNALPGIVLQLIVVPVLVMLIIGEPLPKKSDKKV